jgi:hypothetical protein
MLAICVGKGHRGRVRFETRLPERPPLTRRLRIFLVCSLIGIGALTSLVVGLMEQSWVAAAWGAGVAAVGVVGGLLRLRFWQRRGRWFPGMGLYGASADELQPSGGSSRTSAQ